MPNDNFYYLHSLHKLAAIDGNVSAEEREYLDAVASKLGLSLAEIEKSPEAAPWTMIHDPTLRKLLVKDLFFVSYADGVYDPRESKFIQRIVETYQLPPSVVDDIRDFVRQGVDWIQRGEKLFGLRLL
jgi:uncharacterized tellurite resistance protein B-like protein